MTSDDIEKLLASKPTGRDDEPGLVDMWSPEFIGDVVDLTHELDKLTGAGLLRVLRWSAEHHTYYHGELCELHRAVVDKLCERHERYGSIEWPRS